MHILKREREGEKRRKISLITFEILEQIYYSNMKQQLSKQQPKGLSLQLDELVLPRQSIPQTFRREEWERTLSYLSCLGITDFSRE